MPANKQETRLRSAVKKGKQLYKEIGMPISEICSYLEKLGYEKEIIKTVVNNLIMSLTFVTNFLMFV